MVEIIRTPLDFDRKLNWELLEKQQNKFDNDPELKKILERTVEDISERHMEDMKMTHLLLGCPDHILKRTFDKLNLETDKFGFDDFISFLNERREEDTVLQCDGRFEVYFLLGRKRKRVFTLQKATVVIRGLLHRSQQNVVSVIDRRHKRDVSGR